MGFENSRVLPAGASEKIYLPIFFAGKIENLLLRFFLRERDRFSRFVPQAVLDEVENLPACFSLREQDIFSTSLPTRVPNEVENIFSCLFLAGTKYIFYFAADARSEENIKYICLPPVAAELYWRKTTPLLGSGGFLPPNHPLSPAPLGAAAPRPRVHH